MIAPSITLRAIEHGDLDFLRALANDPEVRAQVVGWDWPVSLAGQHRWFESGPDNESTRRFIVSNESGQTVGMTGLWDIDFRNGTAVSGLKLGGPDEVRGKGYGTSSVQAIMEFAFNDVGLNRLHSTILATNRASLALYVDKSGWTIEGRLRNHVWRNGDYVDVIQIGILASEFNALNG